jgi:hypothetical protein
MVNECVNIEQIFFPAISWREEVTFDEMMINYPLDNKRNIIYANFALAYHELELSFTTLHRFPFLIQTHINMLIKTKTLKIECIIFLLLLFMHFIKANMLLLFLGLSWSNLHK